MFRNENNYITDRIRNKNLIVGDIIHASNIKSELRTVGADIRDINHATQEALHFLKANRYIEKVNDIPDGMYEVLVDSSNWVIL